MAVTTQRKIKNRWLRWLLTGFITLFVLGLGTTVTVLGYLYMTDLPPSQIQQDSELLDREGKPVAMLTSGSMQRQSVKIDQISPYIIDGTIATEDRGFYNHWGIDARGIVRATLVNLEHMSKRQGASTLTQQLARNLYLSHERTWKRKLKEALLALQLEMKYNKDEILALYLNNVYYGHGSYGIEAASQMYFGKSAHKLSLAESAMLVGIPRGPSYYSPWLNMKNAKDRQQVILRGMVELGQITELQAKKAYDEVLTFRSRTDRSELLVAPYFRDYVKKELSALGISEATLATGGLRIYTTLDRQAQAAAEAAIAKHIPEEGELQAAMVSIDPRSGDVKAMIGGKDYRTNQYNRVFAETRQPGSSFKPIVYLAALEKKAITSATRFVSQPTSFTYDEGRKVYKPNNYGDKYYGDIMLRQAIAASDNIYAVNTLMQVGAEQVVRMAERLGIHNGLKPLPSLALGTFPVSPFQMATAYAVLSNEGRQVTPRTVLAVTDAGGRLLYEAPAPVEQQVVLPEEAYILTNLMESVFEAGGTGNRVSTLIKRPVAGKTGTTDSDSWIVGYTPELATAVWVGYDKGKKITQTDARRSAPIFAQFTEKALANVPPKLFPVPDNIVSTYIDPNTGKLAGEGCNAKQLETFVRGTEPKEICNEHDQQQVRKSKSETILPEAEDKKKSWWQHFKRWWSD
ncbi:transglycosylase domain-containing protein [Paenibacillus arenosi]|uniref:PBP1A family penicillin-binding protein n=1 Tax=Paenibacillus arenosi TaxID=2774142 RepID=A0ABR9B4Y1_9BACL|nr:PBP1A family penicillin-binding protein [Paenibacillus arenosi]MBD8500482.1 PBP1A family penicillin-binding protein [Paenibacillus arenosi]